MCGIAGFVPGGDGEHTALLLRHMAEILRHRGPDDEGYLTMDGAGAIATWGGADTAAELRMQPLPREPFAVVAGLAHRRLSILDLSSAGHQPMATASGRYWIVFNGEIYNYLELRRVLQGVGHTFHNETDTEVLLAGFAEWGPAVLTRLEGMFAFAILDREAGTLFLARDHFGIKPLYYARTADGGIAFASEMKALLGLPGVSSSMHPPAIFEFLRYGISDAGSRTMFADILQLPAAHTLTLCIDRPAAVTVERYWALPQRTSGFTSPAEAAEAFRDVFRRSVAMHMRSDAPVGSCLSGGLDSTAIVAFAAAMMPVDKPFRTVSYVSSDVAHSEGPFVEIAREAIPICSELVYLTADDVVQDIRRLVWAQDVPFNSLSIYAQYGVFRGARTQGLTVMLDGQGSDEMLGGYTTAVSAAVAERIACGQIGKALTLARAFAPLGADAYRRTLLSALGRFIHPRAAPLLMGLIGEPVVPAWLDSSWFSDRGVALAVRPQGRGRRALDEELRLFTQELSLPQLLRYEDRNSMAFSIESRVPFCDVTVAEVASRIPTHMLVTDRGSTKAVFRTAMRGIVPDSIIDRPKVGFTTPDQQWLASLQPWLTTTIQEGAARIPFLRADLFAKELETGLKRQGNFSHKFWRMLNVILWAAVFQVTVD